jgi:mannosyltransferase OCH1-like enzyme
MTVESAAMSIPPVLHRIVLAPMRDRGQVHRNWSRFARLHPDWTLRTWTDDDVSRLPRIAPLLPRCSSPAQQADLARLEILDREGGIYVDTDCEPVRPLTPLLELGCFFGTEDGLHFSTGVIGAEPGHPAIAAYLEAVIGRGRVGSAVPPNEATGPMFATRVLAGRADVKLLPPAAFYPEPFEASLQRRRASRRKLSGPDTYVIHRWAHSWQDATMSARPRRLRAVLARCTRLFG